MAEYIEREDLEFPYMTMTLWGLNHETCHAYNEGVKAAADYIASLPAADVAPVVHGRWDGEKDHGEFREVECTACGGILLVKWSDRLSEYRYCPNCGARMDGE